MGPIRRRWGIVFLSVGLIGRCAPVAAQGAFNYHLKADSKVGYTVVILEGKENDGVSYKGNLVYSSGGMRDGALSLHFRGGLTESDKRPRRTDRRGFSGPPRMHSLFFDEPGLSGVGILSNTNEITMTPTGELKSLRGDSQLPYLLGNLSMLIFEPIPNSNDRVWTSKSPINVYQIEGGRSHLRPLPLFGDQPKEFSTGTQEETYTRRADEGVIAVVAKTLRLTCTLPGGGNHRFDAQGDGVWRFNRDIGMPESLDFNQRITRTEGSATLTIPITIHFHRVSDGEVAKWEADEAKGREEAKQRHAEMSRPFTDQEKARLLSDLKSNSKEKNSAALKTLGEKNTDLVDDEMKKLVEKLQFSQDATIRNQANSIMNRVHFSAKTIQNQNELRSRAGDIHAGFGDTNKNPVQKNTRLRVGQKLLTKWGSTWYPSEVVQLAGDRVTIRYIGWSGSDETVERSRLQLLSSDAPDPETEVASRRKANDKEADDESPTPGASADENPFESNPFKPKAVSAKRTWTDKKGKFKVDAEFVSLEDGQVTLKLEDGEEVSVALDKLGAMDQAAAQQLAKRPVKKEK